MTTLTTNVPAPTLGPNGFIAPQQSAILAGVQADQQAAFGGNLNPALNTPQGQLAQSTAAMIGDCNDQFVALANGVDPSYASGRMQDAIGRIYFMTRIPAQATVVTATCVGAVGTVIPIGATAIDQSGNIYTCTQSGTIPSGGSIDLTFQCNVTGPIACPIGFLNTIYQTITGWSTINNASAGVIGYAVESRAAFEFRRQQSVAKNAQGTLPSVISAVFAIPGVTDAFAYQNGTTVTSGAVVTASMSATTMTVTAVASGTLAVGQMVLGTSVAPGTYISALMTGTGGTGTYALNISQTVGSESMTCAIGGVPLLPNSIYVAVYGGSAQAIGNTLWQNASAGCQYNGNTSVTVQDSSSGYNLPYPTYTVLFQTPTPTPIIFSVSMQASPNVPANATVLIQNAIISAFNGTDGGSRARIGSTIFASRYYANISALGPWAVIYSLQLGIGSANANSILMQINQVPTLSSTNIAVAYS